MASIARKQPSRNPLQPCPARAKYSRPPRIEDRDFGFDGELEFGDQEQEEAPVQRSSAALYDRCGKQLDFVPSLEAEGGQQRFQEFLARADGDMDEQLEVRLTTLHSWDPASLADPADPTSWRFDPDATVVETSFRVHSTPEAKEEALRRLIALAESEEALTSGFISSELVSID